MRKKERTVKFKEKSVVNKIFMIVVCVVLCVYALSIITPLVWGIITSLKSNLDFTVGANVIGFPNLDKSVKWNSRAEFLQLANYKVVLSEFEFDKTVTFYIGDTLVQHKSHNDFFAMLFNTLLIAGLGAFLQTIVPLIMGYACAKYPFKYSNVLFAIALLAMVMPVVGAYPSEITLLRNLGVYDTIFGFIFQKCYFGGMYFFVFYGFYKSLPDSYCEAAEIDGASQFRCLTMIILPLTIKMIGTIWLIQFVHFWNDYTTPLLYMPTYPTLAYGVWFLTFGSNQSLTKLPYRVAGAMTLALPILILFIFLKDKLMGNITMGGLKQ